MIRDDERRIMRGVRFNKFDDVMRGLIVKSFEHEKSDFVGNAFSDQQPMEFLEGRCYVFMSFSASAYVVNFLVGLHI